MLRPYQWQWHSQSQWQSALRAVTYASTSEDPTGHHSWSLRTVTFVVSDGDAESNAEIRTVVVHPVMDAPVLAALETSVLNYTENQAATHITTMLTVFDADYLLDVNLETATISISSGLRAGDMLDAATDGTGVAGPGPGKGSAK